MGFSEHLCRAPADPVALARALADRPGLALLHTSAPAEGGVSYVGCDPDGEVHALDPLLGENAPRGLSFSEARVPAYVGLLPYEAFRAIERPRWSAPEDRPAALVDRARWIRYPAMLVIENGEVRAIGEDGAARDLVRRVERGAPPPTAETLALEATFADSDEAHAARVARTIELLYAGDLYQANIARRIDLRLGQSGAPPRVLDFLALYARLSARAPSAFGAAIFTPDAIVLSTSPELCLRADASDDGRGFGVLTTQPIKGTRPRGADEATDRALAAELDADEKERAELTMIIDVERNDLHRVCAAGSVRVEVPPRVITHRTVHHRVATVRGTARADVSRDEVLRAFLPSGSVTGAPRIRAMEVIRTLEPFRRGLYTGAFGFFIRGGACTLSMAIRTAVFRPDGTGEYFTGGGIVVDSVPAKEVEETKWKAAQLGMREGRIFEERDAS